MITDTLDTRLTPNTDLSTVSVSVFGGATFAQGADYTAAWSGQTLTVTLTAAGLAQLEAGQNIVVGFVAAANAVGEIDNIAYVNLNDFELTPGTPNGPDGSPTNEVSTRWGNLTGVKVNSANAADTLAGAQFEIYMGLTDTAGCMADIDTLDAVTEPGTATPLVVTSAADGTIVFPGLWVGDRGLADATMFTDLDRVAVGDLFTVNTFGEVLTYRVVDTRVVDPTDTTTIRQEQGRDLVTLVTCTPLGINSHRILVTGERETPTPPDALDAATGASDAPGFPWWLIAYAGALAAIVAYAWWAGLTRTGAGISHAAGASSRIRGRGAAGAASVR